MIYTRIIWFSLSIVIVLFDQISKWLILHTLELYQNIHVFPGFDLTLQHNKGAAFSFLAQQPGWQRWFFVGLAAIMSLAIFLWLTRLKENEKVEGLGLALILGGAIGNLIDRLVFGHVVDFILLYYKDWQFPAFNIADSAICVGVVLLGFGLLKTKNL
jgi:signal peptidase II